MVISLRNIVKPPGVGCEPGLRPRQPNEERDEGVISISDLKDVADFAPTVAARGWRAWWQDSDVSLSQYTAGIQSMARSGRLPLALVAHEGSRYVGSVLLVESDLEERPQYTPWIAALWVEPEFRRRGIAARLISEARLRAGLFGYACCHLCAEPEKSAFYVARGFCLLEVGVAGLHVFAISGSG